MCQQQSRSEGIQIDASVMQEVCLSYHRYKTGLNTTGINAVATDPRVHFGRFEICAVTRQWQ